MGTLLHRPVYGLICLERICELACDGDKLLVCIEILHRFGWERKVYGINRPQHKVDVQRIGVFALYTWTIYIVVAQRITH